MFTIIFTLILAEWQARAVESLKTQNSNMYLELDLGTEWGHEGTIHKFYRLRSTTAFVFRPTIIRSKVIASTLLGSTIFKSTQNYNNQNCFYTNNVYRTYAYRYLLTQEMGLQD